MEVLCSCINSNTLHCIVIDPIPDCNVMFEILVCLFHVLLGQHDNVLPLWKLQQVFVLMRILLHNTDFLRHVFH